MFSLFLDIAVYNLTKYNTFFVLLPIFIFSYKKEWLKIIIMGIILDFLTNTFIINLIIFLIIYSINRSLFKIFNLKFTSYILIMVLSYFFFILALYLFNNFKNFNISFLLTFFINNILISLIYYLLNYKYVLKLKR